MTPGLTLHVNDYDDEGTLYSVLGRGEPVQTYCILTLRAVLMARFTNAERDALGSQPGHWFAPEHFVSRVVVDLDERADCDYDDEGAASAPWAA